jgi:hypothetical protein
LPLAGESRLFEESIRNSGLCLRLKRKRHVDSHLVAVKVCVERRADERMQADGLTFNKHRLKGLDAKSVQSRRAVQHDRMVLDDAFQDPPTLRRGRAR